MTTHAIDAYMYIGHHTLVTLERDEERNGLYFINTRHVTPQNAHTDVRSLIGESLTSFHSQAIALSYSDGVRQFAIIVADELLDEQRCIESLAA